jgi:uncharacterized protein
MKRKLLVFLNPLIITITVILLTSLTMRGINPSDKRIRILVLTGGHEYNKEAFKEMLSSLDKNISFTIAELPDAFKMFEPENRNKYDVLVLYQWWQKITEEQKKAFSDCISEGKPVVALHHSICSFDDWPEYINIIGGKYLHKPTVVNGETYPASTSTLNIHHKVKIVDPTHPLTDGLMDFDGFGHPVTEGLKDFEVFDETYKNVYVEPGVKQLLRSDEPTSTPVIGWTKMYGRARVVTIQIGHDTPTYQNSNFCKLLKQAIEWVYIPANTDIERPIGEPDQLMPQFPGGEKEMMKFIKSNLKYPDIARRKGISGTVIVNFVVGSDGKLSRIKVMRGIGSGCDEEAVRIFQLMPNWNPGKRGGKAVDVSYTVPFKFFKP